MKVPHRRTESRFIGPFPFFFATWLKKPFLERGQNTGEGYGLGPSPSTDLKSDRPLEQMPNLHGIVVAMAPPPEYYPGSVPRLPREGMVPPGACGAALPPGGSAAPGFAPPPHSLPFFFSTYHRPPHYQTSYRPSQVACGGLMCCAAHVLAELPRHLQM